MAKRIAPNGRDHPHRVQYAASRHCALGPTDLPCCSLPSRISHRYSQIRESRKSRHFGRDAEIQAMDGSQPVEHVFDSGHLPTRCFMLVDTGTPVVTHSLPSLDAGFRHPCRNDGPPTLVYNDESPSLGTCQSNDLRISIDSDRGKIHLKTVVLSLNEGRGF